MHIDTQPNNIVVQYPSVRLRPIALKGSIIRGCYHLRTEINLTVYNVTHTRIYSSTQE